MCEHARGFKCTGLTLVRGAADHCGCLVSGFSTGARAVCTCRWHACTCASVNLCTGPSLPGQRGPGVCHDGAKLPCVSTITCTSDCRPRALCSCAQVQSNLSVKIVNILDYSSQLEEQLRSCRCSVRAGYVL